MAIRSLSQADEALDALDPNHVIAQRGRVLGRPFVASKLADVDAWLDELGGPSERVSGEMLREPPGTDPEIITMDDPYEVMTTLAPPPTPDVGVDPELSFDDLFEDEPQVSAASESLSTLIPMETLRRREHEAVERANLELDADDLAALDSLEIVLDD